MKSGEYFLDTELLNVLNTQNIIIIDIKWQKDQSRINYFGFFSMRIYLTGEKDWRGMTIDDDEWQRVVSGGDGWQQLVTGDDGWQWVTTDDKKW